MRMDPATYERLPFSPEYEPLDEKHLAAGTKRVMTSAAQSGHNGKAALYSCFPVSGAPLIGVAARPLFTHGTGGIA